MTPESAVPLSEAGKAAWTCERCGQRNSGWATECGRCDGPDNTLGESFRQVGLLQGAIERAERAEARTARLREALGEVMENPMQFATDPDGDCFFCGGPTTPIEEHDEDEVCWVTRARQALTTPVKDEVER